MSTKVDIRTIITDTIIQGLEDGKIPWVRPWEGRRSGGAINHFTKKYYRGLNQVILSFVAVSNGWENRWATFKAMSAHGLKVKKGEHGTPVAFFKFITKEDDDGTEETFPMLRYYRVFSISQLEEVPVIEAEPVKEFTPIEQAENIIHGYAELPPLKLGGDKAYYIARTDEIHLPFKEQFKAEGEFYSTYFHEIAHSTGHPKRLARKSLIERDETSYGLEELIAEFTSAFLCAEAGIEKVIQNQTAYIQNWLAVLKDNRQMLFTASSQAQKATDYVLGVSFTQDK